MNAPKVRQSRFMNQYGVGILPDGSLNVVSPEVIELLEELEAIRDLPSAEDLIEEEELDLWEWEDDGGRNKE